ncbi:cytochrome c oxidase assembly factor 7 homolog [Ceratina calcarata]|uniref:Cytochrome c oxidase assembly factor 7 homolog n=1 Tax=Ceratina calcarata TaxID=156304 RepID=A0AAJ7WEF8_9HYME|nr:cytochrome c oxidase assembly factor 7 homolog [Ceratina calcarata]
MAGYNLKNKEELEEYLKNLHIEYQFGCLSEKNPEVCHLLANYHEAVKQDFKEAISVYKKNCDEHNYGKSCTKYGGYRAVGKDCEKDVAEGFKYMLKGCEQGDPKGCLNAGVLSVTDNKLTESKGENHVAVGMNLLRKACDASNEQACFYLSGIFLSGIEGVVEKNFKEAYVLSLKSCEMGNPYACANVSIMHKKGDGVQQNAELAKTFKTRAEQLLKEVNELKKQIKFHQGIDP